MLDRRQIAQQIARSIVRIPKPGQTNWVAKQVLDIGYTGSSGPMPIRSKRRITPSPPCAIPGRGPVAARACRRGDAPQRAVTYGASPAGVLRPADVGLEPQGRAALLPDDREPERRQPGRRCWPGAGQSSSGGWAPPSRSRGTRVSMTIRRAEGRQGDPDTEIQGAERLVPHHPTMSSRRSRTATVLMACLAQLRRAAQGPHRRRQRPSAARGNYAAEVPTDGWDCTYPYPSSGGRGRKLMDRASVRRSMCDVATSFAGVSHHQMFSVEDPSNVSWRPGGGSRTEAGRAISVNSPAPGGRR
jgi:hypothetical protein